MKIALVCLAALAPLAARAEPKVVAVTGADVAAVGALEARLALSPDVTLVPAPFQTEALALAKRTPGDLSDPKVLQQFTRLTGADVVVTPGKGALRVCESASNSCRSVSTEPAALFAAFGLAAAPEVASLPGQAAYATCRAQALGELNRIVLHGAERPAGKALLAACETSAGANPDAPGAHAALLAARALAGDSDVEPQLAALLPSLAGDGLVAATYVHLVATRPDAEQSDVLAAEALAAQVAPRALELLVAIAEAHFRADDFDVAIAWFRKALALAPRSPHLTSRLAYALHSKPDDEAAVKLTAEADRLAGGNVVQYRMDLASRLMDVNRYADAGAILKALHDADPSWGRAALRYGWALYKQGKVAEAVPFFEKAMKAKARGGKESNDRRIAQLDLAQSYALLGRPADALAILETMKQEKGVFAPELADTDFDAIRAEPRFQRLLAGP